MSEKSEIIRRLTDHLNENLVPGPLELYAEDLEFQTRGLGASRETFTGRDGLLDATRGFRDVWESLRSEIVEEAERGDWIVVAFRIHLRSHAGVELAEDEGWAYRIVDGKVQRIEQHPSFEEALAAVEADGT